MKAPAATPRALAQVRRLCATLPGSVEQAAWGEPTWRRGGRMYAMFASAANHHGAGRNALWIKAEAAERDLLVQAAPQRYFVPPYQGSQGWIGAYLDEGTDWDELQRLLQEGHRLLERKPRRAHK
ncbi:MAG: MmcQ/YjbR family DNA-binding protein [Anaerolineales bacterium]|jgi:predicted DNA-binding protein (MmcQ/YjbR family)|nr:MmcQ/YjbR family DNA-binding protein [Anaerolineales bacterium]